MSNEILPLRPHGGHRTGSGRPKRAGPTVLKTLKQEPITLRKKFRLMPLDYCLQIINDPEASKAERLEASRIASPFLHVKLSSIQVTSDPSSEPAPPRVIDVSRLSDDELVELRRLLTKGAPPVVTTLENDDQAPAMEVDDYLSGPDEVPPD